MESSLSPPPKDKVYLVTGGHGFLGSHVARRLYEQEHCHGDLRHPALCELVVRGVHTVLHFAANMGGMGTIHDENDFILYEDNHLMTANLLRACLAAGVKCFFFASSACIYPETLQTDVTGDGSLKESDAWAHPPPKPQGLYGLEKFNSELLLHQFSSKMDIRIGRFHNVFGPGGAWNDGREKAPAAMLRKAWAMKILGNSSASFEIWGGGQQRRSFLYVSDAVDGVLKVLEWERVSSDNNIFSTFNIGSDTAVSIQELAHIALRCAIIDPESVRLVLGWSPQVSLTEGMASTSEWIKQQVTDLTRDKTDIMQDLSLSKVLHLQPATIIFAILLPITSCGSSSPSDCLSNLRRFSQSLFNTTWRDTRDRSSDVQFRIVIYLAIDHDDTFLLAADHLSNKAERVLRQEGICDVVTIVCDHPRGHVCQLWRDCAKRAWSDKCDYMVLMGDDVVLKDEGWMRDAHAEFLSLANRIGVPAGFGCVAFTDTSFPGMPTFPIIHRTHMDIFQGEVVPAIFVNQDGDPFLFQLYRRWGCSTMFNSQLSNSIGGDGDARYVKRHAQDWTFDTLDDATSVVESWLEGRSSLAERKLTLDVVIPCYRVDLAILDIILALKSSASCTVMFIIIIDDPSSPYISHLQSRHSRRSDVRIRVNKSNLGASASRNRGMDESAAEWVHFLDDDVVPDPNLLKYAEEAIRAHPYAAGFVGVSLFPSADSIFTTAVHLAGVTYFWDIAQKIPNSVDLPWGVTANLIARRNVKDGIKFDLSYPKTGGGEDIHFCHQKAQHSIQNGGEGFVSAEKVVVTHPWWNGGKRSYWRFYNWSFGDGGLIKNFPEHVYSDFAPNSAELLLGCAVVVVLGVFSAHWVILSASYRAFVAVVLANILHDGYRHLYEHPERNLEIRTTLKPWSLFWLGAVVESSFIRMFSEVGRLRGLIARGEYMFLGRRFDWFSGRAGAGPVIEERSHSLQRAILTILLFRFLIALG
ncbi:NAD-dependent epimerase/dehydratase [Gymnopilus junonius]|uniref:NAD-dependent epimerase/dehydratase n=1 Tax=Gymnopilus junonius TaxID=109634 RepID=A0A9P5NMU6_GYMJU|nr:NAD-dependent epimerase/dehydratase [Gymnopilus junonius]